MGYKYEAIKKNGYGRAFGNDIKLFIDNVKKYCYPDFDLYVDGVKIDNPKKYLEEHAPKTLEETIVDLLMEKYELKERISQALHRIQLLQMDGEVEIKDLGLIVRDLRGE